MFLLRRHGLFAAIVFCLPGPALLAQGTADGAVQGRVLDARGVALSGTTVIATDVETGKARTAATRADGSFLLAHLAPGLYELTFAGVALPPMAVSLGETLAFEAILRAGGRSSLVFADESRQATFSDLEQSQAAAAIAPDQDADGLISAHGSPSTQNALLLDGVSQTQSFNAVPAGTGSDQTPDAEADSDSAERSNGPAQGLGRGRHAGVAYLFSQSAIREFRISAQNYTAEAGGAAGALLTGVSRGGSARLHGSAGFILRSQAFAAANPLSVATTYSAGQVTTQTVKPHDLRENYAATLGGPVPRVRDLAFFYTFDGQRRGFPAVSSPGNPDFYRLTAIQTALLGTRDVTAVATNSALSYLDSLTGTVPRREDQTLHFGRLDWSRLARQEFGLQYNRVRWSSPAGLMDAPVVARGRASLGNAAGSVDGVLGRWTSRAGSSLSNQLRVQYLRDLQFETPQASLPQEPGIGPGGLAPEVNIGPNGLLFGTPATLSQQAYPDERRLSGVDTVTLVKGHHALEAGAEFTAVDDRVATLADAAGTFRFDSTRTSANAGGLVDFITDFTFNAQTLPNGGCPSIHAAVHLFCYTSFTQSFGEQRVSFATQEWAGFVQDTWRPHPGLTLHAGVRYEYVLLPLPQTPNAGLDAIFGGRGATGVFPEDRNNFGPRVGIDLQPFGRRAGVVRVGYGAYYGRLPGATVRSALAETALPASTRSVRVTPALETACPQTPANPFGYACVFTGAPPAVVALTTSAVVFDRRFRLPMVQQGSVAVERELGRHVMVSATYLLDLDRQLAGSTDLNILPATQTATYQVQGGASSGIAPVRFVLPLYTSRVTPSFGPVSELVSHANGSYNGLVVAGDVRAATLTVRLNYTWSKAIDYGPNFSATPRTMSQLDPFTNGYDKGLSALNYPQAFHAMAQWSPRAPVLKALLDHWTLAPLVLAHSGRAYSYELFGGTRLPGGHLSLNGAGGALYLPTVGRDTQRLPGSVNADLRVSRGFAPGGRVGGEPLRVDVSAEVFNVTNRMNLSSVEERAFLVGAPVAGVTPLVFQDAATLAAEGLTTQPFGTPTGAGTNLARERQVQFSVRLAF